MKLDQQHYIDTERSAPEDLPQGIPITEIMQGLKMWHNPANKFCVVRLHDSADPKKRSEEWRAATRAGMTWSEWMREHEIVFSSFEGIPVYQGEYNRDFHVSKEPLVWSPHYPVVRGWDFGLSKGGMACIFAQLISNFRLFVYKELTASSTAIDKFSVAVKQQSVLWFPGCHTWIDIVDPSGFNRTQIDKRSCVDVIRKTLHTKPIPGEKSIVKRRNAVIEFLSNNPKGIPHFQLDPVDVPMLIEGFDGGYHYGYAKDGSLHDEPEKNEYSHPHDALQMICSRIMQVDLSSREPIQIATAKYNFGRV